MERTKMLAAMMFAAACNADPGATRSALFSGTDPDGGVDAAIDAAADAPVDSPPDAPEPEPIDCGQLCSPGDRLEGTLPIGSYRQQRVDQVLPVSSMGGRIEVTVVVTGNFGSIGAADGVSITIGDGTPCGSQERIPGGSGVTRCRSIVDVGPGQDEITITLIQWNGDVEGWTVDSANFALVMQ